MSELTEREIEAKCKDISTLAQMYETIVDYEKNELNLKAALIKIGDFAGGSQNSISFNYSDENRHYIRNKYGYIQKKKDDTAEPNENGIYFEKLYHLKVILEEKPEFQFAHDESNRLKADLIRLKQKIKYILFSEDDFIQTKDDLVSLINALNLSNNPKMSNIITIAKKYYHQHSLTKIRSELTNFDSKNFNFNIREDRYYFARKCFIVGELLKELMVDEDKKDKSDAFEQFTKIKDKLIHSHEIIATGLNEKENVEMNENVTKIGGSMNDMIKADNENNLFVNYADKKNASCLKENSQKVLKILEGEKSDSSSAPETNESKLKQKKADKNSPKSILVMFDTKVKLAENINMPTKDTPHFTNLNTKYQESLKKLSELEKNDYVGYPERLSLDNKEKIAKIAEEIKESAKNERKQQEVESKSTNSDELVVKTLKRIDQELEYMTKVEQLENIPTKKEYVIEHIIAIIGQYQRELEDAKVTELISQISSEIIAEASKTAISAKDLGLACNIFASNPNELKQFIKRDIMPAREYFKDMLVISDQKHRYIPESIRKLNELAESFFTLGLYNKAIEYWKRFIQEINEEEIKVALSTFGDGTVDIHRMLFGMEFFSFNAHIRLAATYLLFGNYEKAYEVLVSLTDEIYKTDNLSLIKHLNIHKNRLTLEVATISLLAGLCFIYHGHFKEAMILLENAIKLESPFPLLCLIKLHLAVCYFALNQNFEAKDLLEEILEQSELHPIVEVKSLLIYTKSLIQINEMNLIGTKRKFTDKVKAISKKVTNEKEIVRNEHLNDKLVAIVMELETLIANSKFVHMGQSYLSLYGVQKELESFEKLAIQIISKIKNDLTYAGTVSLVYAYLALGYSVLITDGISQVDKEKPKYDKTKYYFDRVEKMYNELNFASRHEHAFTIALQALSNACNNFAYFVEDIKVRIEYLEEALHWLRLIFSSDLKLTAQENEVFSNEKCLTLGNTGIEYHNLGKHYLLGINNFEKSYDDAFKCFEDAISTFGEMLEMNENKIYITKPKDIEVLKSFALSYESAGFLRYKLSFIKKAMTFYDEAIEEWGDTAEIIQHKQHCRQIISCMKSAFEEIQNHLNTKQARELGALNVFEIELLYPAIDLYALSFYSKDLQKKRLIHNYEMTGNSIILYLLKRNIKDLKNVIKKELQFIDNIEKRKRDEPKTFIFDYKKNSFVNNDGVSTEQKLKITNKKGVDYYQANDFDKAIEKYNECIQLLDKLPECALYNKYRVTYMFNRARAHHKKGDLLAAICDYHATLKLDNAHEKASNYLKSCFETDSQPATKENEQEQKLIRLLTNGINIVNVFSADEV